MPSSLLYEEGTETVSWFVVEVSSGNAWQQVPIRGEQSTFDEDAAKTAAQACGGRVWKITRTFTCEKV
jgi:hypothetical protein